MERGLIIAKRAIGGVLGLVIAAIFALSFRMQGWLVELLLFLTCVFIAAYVARLRLSVVFAATIVLYPVAFW
jgi:hypothetical protein